MGAQARSNTATLWMARAGLVLAMLGWGLRVVLGDALGYGGVVALIGCGVSLLGLALAIALKSRGASLAFIGAVVGALAAAALSH